MADSSNNEPLLAAATDGLGEPVPARAVNPAGTAGVNGDEHNAAADTHAGASRGKAKGKEKGKKEQKVRRVRGKELEGLKKELELVCPLLHDPAHLCSLPCVHIHVHSYRSITLLQVAMQWTC